MRRCRRELKGRERERELGRQETFSPGLIFEFRATVSFLPIPVNEFMTWWSSPILISNCQNDVLSLGILSFSLMGIPCTHWSYSRLSRFSTGTGLICGWLVARQQQFLVCHGSRSCFLWISPKLAHFPLSWVFPCLCPNSGIEVSLQYYSIKTSTS